MENRIKSLLLMGIILSIIFATAGISFAQTEITESDRKAIRGILDELGQAIVREDFDSIMARLSPNMDREKYNEIKETIEKRFSKYDYSQYIFWPLVYRKIVVLEPGRKVKFKVRYSEKYTFGTSGSGSSSSLTANFTMEKINEKWLILDTDFYTKERFLKTVGLGVGLFILIGIGGFVFWLCMLIDCAKRDFIKSNDKIIWIFVILLVQIIGALVYYFVIKRKSRPAQERPTP